VDQDANAFTRFIARWITVNQRWNSPKYLMGESYGTLRSRRRRADGEPGMSCSG